MSHLACRPRTPAGLDKAAGVLRATAKPGSRRFCLWNWVFHNGVIPLLWPNPHEAAPVYAIATASLTRKERRRLALVLSEHLHFDQEQIDRLFARPQCGVPILAEDVLLRVPRRSTA